MKNTFYNYINMCKKGSRKTTTSESNNNLWKTLSIAGIIVVIIWILSWVLIDIHIKEITDRGTFGDKFGAVNALFSGLAFAGLIVTLLYQKEELKLQREELAQTREELKGQREEYEEQNKTLRRQRFENTFFNMLSLQQEIISNLSYDKVERVVNFSEPYINKKHIAYNGRSIFREIYLNLDITTNNNSIKGIKQAIKENGIKVYSYIPSTTRFDHYFRHLYHIYKYVDTCGLISDEERYDYACIIRSQLSDYELVMLFYNCLTSNGDEKFKPLIEKYAIFNNLREELLADIKHKEEYAKTAYNQHAQ